MTVRPSTVVPKTEDALRLMEQRYRSLVEAITAIIWNTPASGEFECEQPGWSAFTGQTFEQLKGWGWLNAVHPDDRPHTACVWSAAVAARTLYEVEHRLRRHDGTYRDMLVRAVPILGDDGAIREWVGVHTDITDQKRVERALREAKDAADAANRAKSEFLANMSHEIRTPLNGIIGMTELTLGTELTRQQREYLGMVKSSADALLTILNDILDFSKIEAGRLTLDPVEFRLRNDLGDTLRALAVRADPRKLELLCHVAPDVPDRLVGDIGRLRQVIINLIGNAIKFTERGEVALHITRVDPDPEPDPTTCLVRFRVTDTGIGIPPEKLDSIFQPFTQADTTTTRRFGGTGLGLTISAQLVAMMGGGIGVESELGRGSTFFFTARFGLPTTPPPPEPAVPAQLVGLPVLVVDDNPINRRWLHDLLGNWGMQPTLVEGGPAALDALAAAAARGEPFGLVLLDVMMPEMDGFSVAEQIAARPGLKGTRVLMLSSAGQAGDVARCRAGVVVGYLTKPVKQSDLFDQILAALSLAPHASTRAVSDDPTTLLSGRRLRILLAEDNLVNQTLAVHMLENAGHTVVLVDNGEKAVAAVEQETFDVVLMDVQMPDMGGFEATRIIREREAATGKRVPIIALTAHAMSGDREKSLAAGMDDHVTKPLAADDLWQAIDRVLANRPAVAAPSVAPLPLPPVLRNNPKLLARLVPSFLGSAREAMATIRHALDAGDIKRAGFAAHGLKSSLGTFGATAAQDAAQRLETCGEAGDLAGCRDAFTELDREMAEVLPRVRALVDRPPGDNS